MTRAAKGLATSLAMLLSLLAMSVEAQKAPPAPEKAWPREH